METVDIRLLVTWVVFDFFPLKVKDFVVSCSSSFLKFILEHEKYVVPSSLFLWHLFSESVILILKVFDLKPGLQTELFSGLP